MSLSEVQCLAYTGVDITERGENNMDKVSNDLRINNANIGEEKVMAQESENNEPDIIDLTNDNMDVLCHVRFSKKKKRKKEKKQKREKAKEINITGEDTTLKLSDVSVTSNEQEHRDGTFASVATMQNISLNDDFIIIESSGLSAADLHDLQRNIFDRKSDPNPVDYRMVSSKLPSRACKKLKKINYSELCDDVFACQHCTQKFEKPEDLIDHLSVHEQIPGSYICPHVECKRTFQNKRGLQTHIGKAHERKSYACQCCPKSFDSKTDLQRHQSRIQAKNSIQSFVPVFKGAQIESDPVHEKVFVCERCGQKYATELYLKRHQVMHTKGLMFGCENCGWAFSTEDALDAHIATHTNGEGEELVSQIACPEQNCGQILPSMRAYKFHVRQHNSEEISYPCPQCGYHFSEWGNLLRHLKIHLGIMDHECTECGKKFVDSVSLISHIRRSHTGERPYKCNECPKAFHMKSDLNRHGLKHSSLQRHRCTDCGEKFKSRCALVAHMRRKAGEKPWQCEVCSKRFAAKGGLKTHMISHSKLKRFECATCQKQFSYRASLVAHIRSHSGIMPFLCRICGKQFSHSSNMRRHENTVHV